MVFDLVSSVSANLADVCLDFRMFRTYNFCFRAQRKQNSLQMLGLTETSGLLRSASMMVLKVSLVNFGRNFMRFSILHVGLKVAVFFPFFRALHNFSISPQSFTVQS